MIIGLDIATTTGIAIGKPGGKPLCWSQSFGKDEPHEVRFSRALNFTIRLLNENEPTLIVYERPWKQKRDSTKMNEILMGLVAVVRAVAHSKNVRCVGVTTSQIDKHFLGFQPEKNTRKDAIFKMCKTLQYDVPDQDAADAAAIWSLACGMASPAFAAMSGPLFHGRQTYRA